MLALCGKAARLGNDSVLYHSLLGLVSPRVQCVDHRNQSVREFMAGLLKI
jgi:hypothetical protein